jgi:hypothetical protein
MTTPSGVDPSGEDASEAVGYTYPPRSSRRQESTSTGRHPGIAPGAASAAAASSASTEPPDAASLSSQGPDRGEHAAARKHGRVEMAATVTVSPSHDVEYHLESILTHFLNSFSCYVHEFYPDAVITSEVTSELIEERRPLDLARAYTAARTGVRRGT